MLPPSQFQFREFRDARQYENRFEFLSYP
jgi:hypothetical protein